jgi:hypothetical protein
MTEETIVKRTSQQESESIAVAEAPHTRRRSLREEFKPRILAAISRLK